MSAEGCASSSDASRSLRLITDAFLAPWQPVRGESGRGTDWRTGKEKEEMEKGENVKSGALEVILAGNLSYHSDLVKALQQGRGKRERERERERGKERGRAEVLCLTVLVLDRTFFERGCWLSDYRSLAQAHDQLFHCPTLIIDITHVPVFILTIRGTWFSATTFLSFIIEAQSG